ncbi:hypothetical protein GH714_029606 [Hevea brasiliensis]|uniref:Uncharacterized protein n=1 Tax=Hevea brasiliensis TaxID=3981 RepID=A0A6A6KW65_HEVBR|nr:hypothetical protein GH714_029606 [Hevea brasiliensis]
MAGFMSLNRQGDKASSVDPRKRDLEGCLDSKGSILWEEEELMCWMRAVQVYHPWSLKGSSMWALGFV